MSFRLKLSDAALADLDLIMDYISSDSPLRAEAYVDELLEKIRTLKTMPKRCAVAPESSHRDRELRHLIHGSYRILFAINGTQVTVLRVIHGARLFLDVRHT